MPLQEDPTPCPRPRRSTLSNPRLPLLGGNEPSTSSLGGSKPVGLRDGKPRRPRKRESLAWDPTVDIFEDNPPPESPVLECRKEQACIDIPHAGPVSAQSNKRQPRRSTLFAQPAQRASAHVDSSSSEKASPRKRRLSSVLSQGIVNTESMRGDKITGGSTSIQGKEARRRTIYMPNDTTVVTIHPGASLKANAEKYSNSRKSDVFLDLATLTEDKITQSSLHGTDREALPRARQSRQSRQSLLGAPRRAPLQVNSRQIQPQAVQMDMPGKGGGKENVPPGGTTAMPRKLGKRASLIIPPKATQKASTPLTTVGEDSELKMDTEMEHKMQTLGQHSARSYQSVEKLAAPNLLCQSTTRSQPPRRLSHSQSLILNKTDSHDGTLPLAGSMSKASRHVPQCLSIPKVDPGKRSSFQKYSALVEDISHPELYEDSWLSQQEQSVMELANNLFSKASGYESWREPMSNPRKTLLDMYNSSENALLYKRLQASLRFGALSIPSDTLAQVARFRDDFGQRQRFLDLWVRTYDLESLQIAAEVVVGRKRVSSPGSSANAVTRDPNLESKRAKSVTKFLQTFLVQNQDIGNRRCINTVGPLSPGASETGKASSHSTSYIWRRTALRSLMLIHTLDLAQRRGLFFGRNLFQTASPYKSSTGVLQGLCRLVMPSVGDATRVLGHLGFSVDHKQYPLEEFKYEMGNLATDLRDGVRLTRLVECLLYPPGTLDLQKNELTVTLPCGEMLTSRTEYYGSQGTLWPLSQHLKYPCAARSQRLYNAEIALAALNDTREGREGLLHDIYAPDIVDGHREKTVRLLWSLVSRWGLGSLIDFALVIRESDRLRQIHRRRTGTMSSQEKEDSELSYVEETERQTRMLQGWARNVAQIHGQEVNNLTTSFADGKVYTAIAREYCIALQRPGSSQKNPTTSNLGDLLSSFGCSKSFVSLFIDSNASPSKTTTISLLAFLASRILPVATTYFASISIQRAFRSHRARFDTKRRVILKCLAEECAEIVLARDRLVKAVTTLQKWWRRCKRERVDGTRRWV